MDGQVYREVIGSVFGYVLSAMLGLRSSRMGADVQASTIELHQVADRKEVMVARTNHKSILVTTT